MTKEEYEVADIDEDEFVYCVLPDGDLRQDLKLPKDDEEVYNTLKNAWDTREDNTVFFTIQKAVGKEKFISHRIK